MAYLLQRMFGGMDTWMCSQVNTQFSNQSDISYWQDYCYVSWSWRPETHSGGLRSSVMKYRVTKKISQEKPAQGKYGKHHKIWIRILAIYYFGVFSIFFSEILEDIIYICNIAGEASSGQIWWAPQNMNQRPSRGNWKLCQHIKTAGLSGKNWKWIYKKGNRYTDSIYVVL